MDNIFNLSSDSPYFQSMIVSTIIFAILIIVGIILIIYLCFGVFNRGLPPPSTLNPNEITAIELNYNKGASNGQQINSNNGIDYGNKSLCLSGTNTNWNISTNSCTCNLGYYGSSCATPIYDQKYYPLGQKISGGTATPTVVGGHNIDGISFTQNSATSLCNNIIDCKGFSLNNNIATFFSDLSISNNGHIDFDPTLSPLYYMKVGSSPKFPDRIFLMKIQELPPLRYWYFNRYEDENFNMISLESNTVYQLTFIPNSIINDGNHTIIISDDSFSYFNIFNLINNTPPNFIKFSGSQLPLFPPNWTLPYYVAFA